MRHRPLRLFDLILGSAGALLLTACAQSASTVPPTAPTVTIEAAGIKALALTWDPIEGATGYRVQEALAGDEAYTLVADLAGDATEVALEVFLPALVNARYTVAACNVAGCTASPPIAAAAALAGAIGYGKPVGTDGAEAFGSSVALSADGRTLAVGALGEDGTGTGTSGDPVADGLPGSGAVYVFVRDVTGAWAFQAYVKATNPGAHDQFGAAVALSSDGATLVVGAPMEDGGIGGVDAADDDGAANAGAAYVFERAPDGSWAPHAKLKPDAAGPLHRFGYAVAVSGDGATVAVGAPEEDALAEANGAAYVFQRDLGGAWAAGTVLRSPAPDANDFFGFALALSSDGATLAVGAPYEDGGDPTIGGDPEDDSVPDAGAVHVFRRSGSVWSAVAYVKAPVPDADDLFGTTVALARDGRTLAVGAPHEAGSASGVDGDPNDDGLERSGAAFVYALDGGDAWTFGAYLKASNPGLFDRFGSALALSDDGSLLAVGAYGESGSGAGLDGDPSDDGLGRAGAVYLFGRDGGSAWTVGAYVKAINPGAQDEFGGSVALAGDGRTLAVGAPLEDGSGTGFGGRPSDDALSGSGAVYLY